MDSRREQFTEGQQVPRHPWVATGQLYGDSPSRACLHCMHGQDNPVHAMPDNVISLADRRARGKRRG